MKKRSMLAVASLAAGVVASLTAPSAHADSAQRAGLPGVPNILNAGSLLGALDTVKGGEAPHDSAVAQPDRPRH